MAFTDPQLRQLKAKLDEKHVKTRNANGTELSYVEGWHTLAEANRIFGYDAWDRRTIFTSCVWTCVKGSTHQAAYIAKVRVTVRAGTTKVVREGSGSGEANAATSGQAHELALKAAETDATKRALATFGNPFGLALYDREQNGVRRASRSASHLPGTSGPWTLRSASGAAIADLETDTGFVDALRLAMSEVRDIERLYDIWEQNIETLRAIHRSSKEPSGVVPKLVAHLRACAVALVKGRNNGVDLGALTTREHDPRKNVGELQKTDKSVLTISEPRRIRSKEHLRFIATQPCLVCGRSPAHAHHVRYAQPRGLSLKVSDEFTVPLCAIHHHSIHTTGKEREWWLERNIDPLKIASELWQKSHEINPAPGESNASEALSVRHPFTANLIDQSDQAPKSDAESAAR
jgi:Rad52/22 family double-strand break repair protein